MNAPAILRPHHSVSAWTEKDIALIRRTMAKDANDDEFSVFMKTAKAGGLDPLRKQIYCAIYNADDPAKRNMVLMTAISGLRSIADRTGNYRPDDQAAVYHILPWKASRDNAIAQMRAEAERLPIKDRKAFLAENMDAINDLYPIDPANPEGIEKAVVRVFKHSHGAWHAVEAEAYWEEYAPIKEDHETVEWVDTGEVWKDTGKPKRRKVTSGALVRKLDTSGQWHKMPRGQIAKCAEALALRKAWPDSFANLYGEEEMDRAKCIDLSPAEMAEIGTQQSRLERVEAKDCLLISWNGTPTEPLDNVPIGAFADRALAFIDAHKDEPSSVLSWQDRNRHSLRTFFALHKGDALEIKRQIERISQPALA